MPSRISPLSEDAISQIHSSKSITSLKGVVLALLENALDANASKVEVTVNFSRGSCALEDNGTGIPSSEFLERGGLGKMYHTSKATSQNPVHGSTGTYLSSLASLSLLSITSRHPIGDVSASLLMHQGKVIAREVPSQPANEMVVYGTHGTIVTVNDLFGNMPVRVKHRALTSAQGIGADEKQWLELKRDIAALLLSWPEPCSVKLRDSDNSGKNITLSGGHPTVSSSLTENNLNRLNGRSTQYDLRDAITVLFQAGLASFDTRRYWIPVSAYTSRLSCRGMICLAPAPTRLCQFISIGVQPCSTESGHSSIYEAVNKTFSNSNFGTVDENFRPDANEKIRGAGDRRTVSRGSFSGLGRSSKGVDRWPMFVLQLKLKNQNDTSRQETEEGQLKGIVEILEVMVQQWLAANNLRPRQGRRPKFEGRGISDSESMSPARFDRERLVGEEDSGQLASRHFVHSGRATPSPAKRRRLATPSDRTSAPKDRVSWGRERESDVAYLSKIRIGQQSSTTSTLVTRTNGNLTDPATTGQVGTGALATRFALPPLEPGELGSISQIFSAARASSEPPSHSQHNCSHKVSAQPREDFGSIDDIDLAKVADSWEEANHDDPSEDLEALQNQGEDADEAVDWVDPVTKEVLRVNTRTGAVLPGNGKPGTSARRDIRTPSTASNIARTPAGRPLTLAKRPGSVARRSPHNVVPAFVNGWQNPVFEAQKEERIPVAPLPNPEAGLSNVAGTRHNHADGMAHIADASLGSSNKLSKASLLHVKVIRQIDSKFILCSMPRMDGAQGAQTLVLVDQHAASERVILENLLTELFHPLDSKAPAASFRTNTGCSSAVTAVFLEQPIVFEITTEESKLFRSDASHFAKHGILYDLHATSQTRQHHSLATLALPPGIAERCRLFPKLLIDLLRGEVWSRVEAGKVARSNTTTIGTRNVDDGDDHAWLARLGTCPKGLLDMLNSRACRSAVMFNDVLSMDECRDLLRQLGDCAFPFMCAHGRVSMVPVGELEGSGMGVSGTRNKETSEQRVRGESVGSYMDAFRKWKRGGSI